MVDEVMKEHGIPGAIVGIWEGNGETYVVEKGVSDLETGKKISAKDRIRIASNTKTFTAALILQLVKEGRLSLEDKLSKFYPEVPNAGEITIRQMLAMNSGIHGMYDLEALMDKYYNAPLTHWEPEEIYDIIIKQKPDFAPGEKVEYSDSNYLILGMIAEKATGEKVEDLIQNKIIKPLNLTSTSFPTGTTIPSPFAHGYRNYPDNGPLSDITIMDPSVAWTAGAMISNAYDMNRWVREIHRGTLLNPELQKERMTFKDMGNGMSYGLGVIKVKSFIGHNGTILGYNSLMMYYPEEDITIITIVNRMNDTKDSPQPAFELFVKTAKILFPGL